MKNYYLSLNRSVPDNTPVLVFVSKPYLDQSASSGLVQLEPIIPELIRFQFLLLLCKKLFPKAAPGECPSILCETLSVFNCCNNPILCLGNIGELIFTILGKAEKVGILGTWTLSLKSMILKFTGCEDKETANEQLDCVISWMEKNISGSTPEQQQALRVFLLELINKLLGTWFLADVTTEYLQLLQDLLETGVISPQQALRILKTVVERLTGRGRTTA